MAGKKKPLWKSLTVQSAALIALIVLARVFAPDYFSEDLLHSLLAVLGFTNMVGLRRALPILIVCTIPLGFSNCATVCDNAKVTIGAHPDLPTPAGVVRITCDGELKAEIKAKRVPSVSCNDAAICCEGIDNIPLPEEVEE